MFSKIIKWFSSKDSYKDDEELEEEFEEDDDFIPERISILKEELK